MKNRKRILILAILAILIIIIFVGFSEISKRFHILNNKILTEIEELQNYENELDKEILRSGFFLFYNYDNITYLITLIENAIQKLENEQLFKRAFPETYKYFTYYKFIFKEEKNDILRYISINSIMKNSQIYIPSLALRYMNLNKNKINVQYLNLLIKIVSTVFLLKNSLDDKYLDILKDYKQKLENFSKNLKTDKELRLNRAYIRHIETIIRTYPEYKKLVNILIKKNYTERHLFNLHQIFLKESQEKSQIFSVFSIIANVLFLIFISYIAILLVKVDRQNLKLKLLADSLEKSLKTDELTGLPNRIAFNLDIRDKYKSPSLILLNIDGFKNINDIYGNQIGDLLLINFGNTLSDFIKGKKDISAKVYRLGADEFGIVIENNKEVVYPLAQEFIKYIENKKFEIQDFIIYITISVGISYEKPLFENADLALKKAKTSRERIVIYSPNLDTKKQLENNLRIINLVKYALENDKILLYYQPIMDNKTGKIDKYEVLFRIEDENENIVSPFEVLQVIKETKYYRYLTERIINKAFETLEKHKNIKLSINISYEDIHDRYIKENVIYKNCSKDIEKNRITFEILESESIKDFENMRNFVKTIKQCGIKFAIDDFGSGYSNFVYLAELKPDYLKIDGSLIKQIHQRKELRKIVETINDFAHQLGIKTVAEFVHSEEVLQVVKEIGIDYSQGFYIGKPSSAIKL